MERVNIGQHQKEDHTVYLPEKLYHQTLNYIKFSNKIVECHIKPHRSETMLIAEDLWKKCSIPYSTCILLEINNETINIFPLIGIFTAGKLKNSPRPFGERTNDFKHLLSHVHKKGGYAFIFGPDDLDWQNGMINGLFYNEGWETCKVPFPHVVYDRIPSRRKERDTIIKQIKETFIHQYGIPWFNSKFFNKWMIYQMLKNHPLSSQYLPNTKENFTRQDIIQFLNHYKAIYFKPKNGSKGQGIKKLQKDNKEIICEYYQQGQYQIKKYDALDDLISFHFPGNLLSHYILQQGINLIKENGRPIDFRIHTNKDGDGKWQMSAAAAKVAGKDSITTHVSYGGQVKSLHDLFSKKAEEYLIKLKNAAITLTEIIDQQSNELIGELGLDIGIDEDGRIWLFEANSRPGRTIFKSPAIRKQDYFVKNLWYDYCCHLTKQTIKHPDWMLSTQSV
ncbi:YheC/YheD family protein [Scopulibacillus cellulosilyticus]|uniref:YheC/YheD family protein n=1 Tax=Scopulibacillus cellulosilyticus TaxID=2665665 RepID=A0ABW2PQH4_9BACL